MDGHKTNDEFKLDILSDQRQAELSELLDYIKKFQPTKIMIKSGYNTGYLMNRMRRSKRGEEKLGWREGDQIGIHPMDELQLNTIYAIYASSIMGKMIITETMLYLQKRIVSIQFETAANRYQTLLKEKSDIELRVPLKHIASYLGITLETLSRIRAQNLT